MHVAVECFFFSNRDNIVDAASIGQRSRWGKSNRNRKTHIGLIKRLWTFPVRWLHADGVIHELRFLFFPTPPPPSVLFPPPPPWSESVTVKRVRGSRSTRNWSDARSSLKLFHWPLQIARRSIAWLVRYMFEKSAVADPFEKIFAVISPTETGHWSKEKSTCAAGRKAVLLTSHLFFLFLS